MTASLVYTSDSSANAEIRDRLVVAGKPLHGLSSCGRRGWTASHMSDRETSEENIESDVRSLSDCASDDQMPRTLVH